MGYVVRATWKAKKGSQGVVQEALRELAPLSRQESGCQLYVAYKEKERPLTFHLFEIYDNQSAFQAHIDSEHFQRLGKHKAIPALEDNTATFFETLDI